MPFLGRKEELQGLEPLLRKKSASLVIVRGRRRIGKSCLIGQFSKQFERYYCFAGLAPSHTATASLQKEEFLRQMRRQGIRSLGEQDWGSLFEDVAYSCKDSGRTLILFDEISWMAQGDNTFLAKLKNAWDFGFKSNPELILVLSGSNSTWIEKNLLQETGFVGRISYRLHLQELALDECSLFWGSHGYQVSPFEKYKLLSVTGGIPRYLEEIDLSQSSEENIRRLCFRPEGLLFHEFEEIFSDSLSHRSPYYKQIIIELAEQRRSLAQLSHALGRERSGGDLSHYVDDLFQADFIANEYGWDLETGKEGRFPQFRLSDNYTRFYVKFIEPHKQAIQAGTMRALPAGWDGIMGLQFENLVLAKKNRIKLYELLELPLDSIVRANPFLQTATARRQKCQIDFLIQTRDGSLYICEIKFSKNPLSTSLIAEVQQKIERLKRQRYFSCRPILIHVNGVSEGLRKSDFFVKIIDFSCLLT